MKKVLIAASLLLTSNIFAAAEVTAGGTIDDLVEKCRRASDNGQNGDVKVKVKCTREEVTWERDADVVVTRLMNGLSVSKKVTSSKQNVAEAKEFEGDEVGAAVKCPVFKKVAKTSSKMISLTCKDLNAGRDLSNICTETFEEMTKSEIESRTRKPKTVETFNPCAGDLK